MEDKIFLEEKQALEFVENRIDSIALRYEIKA